MPRLTLHLLGQPRIEHDGAAVVVDTRKATALLAYLALSRGAHSRESLAALLWPEYEHARAFANLRRTVWALSKALGGEHLRAERDTLALADDPDIWVDAERFRALVAAARAHPHPAEPCPACADLLAEAAALYRDGFLHGFGLGDSPGFEEWQFFHAEALRRDAAYAFERLAGGPAGGEPAIGYARRWLALDPLHEPAQRALIRLYAAAGQRSAALRQYEECARLLRAELGGEPEPETAALYAQLRAGRAAEREAQGRAGQAEEPAGAAPARPQPRLPAPPGRLIGRDAELAELARLLADPACRLVTLVGPGGIGKTRLALAAGQARAPALPDGAAFVACAGGGAPALAAAIADALGFAFYGQGDPLRQLADFLRPRRLLLLVDGAEALGPAAELLGELLAAAPGLSVLATSLERLNLREEWAVELQGLACPPAGAPGDGYDAVRLFGERARHVYVDFAASPEDQAAVAQICRLVGGMPLGIELAASWLRVLTPAAIVREVEQSLDFLVSSLRNVPERHRSLRAVFEQSWRMLDGRAAATLARLALFRGGFTREAAARVAEADLGLLAALVDRALLRRHPSGRYEMPGVIQRYAEGRLAPAERDLTAAAHADYYAELVAGQAAHIRGGDQQAGFAGIRAELENVRAGLLRAVALGRPAAAYVAGLYPFFEMQSRFLEGEELFAAAAELGERGDPLLAASLRSRQGGLCCRLGRYEQAVGLLEGGLAAFRAAGADAEAAFCLYYLGDVARVQGRYADARALLEESLARGRAAGDTRVAARALTNLGALAGASGEYGEARACFEASLAIFLQLSDRWGEAKARTNLGNVAYLTRDFAAAEALHRDSLAIARALSDRYGIAVSLNNLGLVAQELGRYAEARALHEESCGLFDQIGYRLGAGLTLNDLGHVASALGDHAGARSSFTEALRTAAAIQAVPLALDAMLGLAELLAADEPAQAAELLGCVARHPAVAEATRARALERLAALEDRALGEAQAAPSFDHLLARFLSPR